MTIFLKKLFNQKNRKIIYTVSAIAIIVGSLGALYVNQQINLENWKVMIFVQLFLMLLALFGILSCFLEEVISKFLNRPTSIAAYAFLSIVVCVGFGFISQSFIKDYFAGPVEYSGECQIRSSEGKTRFFNLFLFDEDTTMISIDSSQYYALGGKNTLNQKFSCNKEVEVVYLPNTKTLLDLIY